MSYLKPLNEAFQKLAKAKSLDDLIRRAIRTLQDQLGFDRAGFLMYDSVTNEQVGTWGTGPDGKIRNEYGYRSPLPENTITSPKKSSIMLTKNADLPYSEEHKASTWTVQSAVFSKKELFGWLYIDNCVNNRPITDDEYEAIQVFSNVFSQLIVRSNIQETLVEALDTLATHEDLTLDALDKVKQLEQQIAGNRKLVTLAEQLSGLVPISARSVGVIVHFLSLLTPDQFSPFDQPVFDSAQKSAQKLAKIFQYFDKQVHEATDNDVQTLPASLVKDYWLRQFTGLFRNTPHQLDIDVDCPDEAVSLPLILLTQMVKELLTNALLHGFEQHQEGQCRISLSRGNNVLIVNVEDSGKGLEEHQFDEVLRLFSTSKPEKCLGSGLNVTQHYMERWFNGQLDLKKSDLGGLCCTLTIPVFDA